MLVVQKEITRLTAEINQLTNDRARAANTSQQRIAEFDARIAILKQQRSELEALTRGDTEGGLQAQIDQLNTAIAEANQVINDKNSTIAQKDQAIASREASITTLNAAVAQRDATIVSKDATIATKDASIVTLGGQVEALQDQVNDLLEQLEGGTFIAFDEARIGDISGDGFSDFLMIYESSMVAPGDADTDPPDPVFLHTYFGELKAANPNVTRICLDYETWPLINNTASGPQVNLPVVNWYVTLVNAAKAHFPNVGLYGEIAERYTLYLNYAVGHATHTARKNAWFDRAIQLQPIWDAVDTIYPSIYYINPVYQNADDRDLWYADIAQMCALRAPGKKVYPVIWPRVHSSVNEATPYIDGDYYEASLNKIHELFPGYVLWLMAADVHPNTLDPVPAWWTKTLARHTAWGLIS